MKELLNIFILLFLLLSISFFPISILRFKNFFNVKKLYLFDFLSTNFLINTIFLLFLSFTKFNFQVYLLALISCSIIFNIYQIIKYKSKYDFLKKEFIFFLIIISIISIKLSANPTLSWDGLENWYFKAQNFFYGLNFFNLNETLGINYYPHLGTYLWGIFWKSSFFEYEYYGRIIYVYIFVLSIFAISDLIKDNHLIKPVFISLIVIICYDEFLFGGYQDVLLFSFLIFTSKYLYFYLKTSDNKYLLLSFLYLNLLPWIKNEGYIFAIITIVSLLCLLNFLKKKEIILFMILSILLILLKFIIFNNYLSVNLTHGANLKFNYDINGFVEFLKIFLLGLVVAIFKYKIWILIMMGFIFMFRFKKVNKKNIFYKFLKINFVIYFLSLVFIYYDFLDEPRGLYWWIHTTLDRFLYSISGSFIILLALIIEQNKYYFKK